jgi:hypothetical protein
MQSLLSSILVLESERVSPCQLLLFWKKDFATEFITLFSRINEIFTDTFANINPYLGQLELGLLHQW